MKKRLFSLLLILALALGLCAAAHAEELRFIYDENDLIGAEDERVLEDLGARIYAETDTAVCFYIVRGTTQDWEQLEKSAASLYSERVGSADGILFLVQVDPGGENRLTCHKVGDKLASLSDEDLTEITQAFFSADSYAGGVHNCMNMVYAKLRGTKSFGEVTPEDNPNIPTERQLDHVVDRAGVLDAASLARLNTLANEVSEKYRCDVAVVFIASLNGRDVVDYADDFYDYNGYGYGPDDDGILLLVAVEDRDYAETTYGYGKTAFTDSGMMQVLEPGFTPYLSAGDWAGAAERFITDAGELLRQAREGNPYDYQQPQRPQREQKSFLETVKEKGLLAALISAVIGFFSGGIPTSAMKRQMKSVEKEYGAANYARGGLNLRMRDDRFLYSNVARTPIPHETRSSGGGGGGSSVHFSSSGRSHGGSHGKF